MSPLEIEIILHYHCCQSDYRDTESPAAREAFRKLVDANILQFWNKYGLKYVANKIATQLYVDAICAVPLPIQKWIMEK